MRWIAAALLIVHGLFHLMGFAKAFGYAQVPQLTLPISREMGLFWLVAAMLMMASGAARLVSPSGFWMIGAIALAISQAVILSAWRDAWAGTIVNVALLMLVVYGWLTLGPASFRAQFERDATAALARPIEGGAITESDLAAVPEAVRRYLRATGVVGQPRVQDYRLRFAGRIRGGPGERWMPYDAVQHSFADRPTRLFLMRASRFGVPIEAFHRLINGHATMQVTMAGVIPLVDARGDVMDQSETVTLFNDMCILAPATLVDPHITWEPVDAVTVRARFSHGGHSISARLLFGDDGLLTNFVSDDRSRSSPDGRIFTCLRFSTPVRDYRAFGHVRLASHGEARWQLPEGEFTYGEFDLQEVVYNSQR